MTEASLNGSETFILTFTNKKLLFLYHTALLLVLMTNFFPIFFFLDFCLCQIIAPSPFLFNQTLHVHISLQLNDLILLLHRKGKHTTCKNGQYSTNLSDHNQTK